MSVLVAVVEKKNKLVTAAKDSDIQVIDVGFLEAVKKGGAASLIKQHSICSWGSEVSLVCNLVLGCFGLRFSGMFQVFTTSYTLGIIFFWKFCGYRAFLCAIHSNL